MIYVFWGGSGVRCFYVFSSVVRGFDIVWPGVLVVSVGSPRAAAVAAVFGQGEERRGGVV